MAWPFPSRPLRIWRSDAASKISVGGSATVNSGGAPTLGKDTVTLFFNLPATMTATLNVQEKCRGDTSYTTTFTTALVAGEFDKVLPIKAEHMNVQLVRTDAGVTALTPSFLVTLT